MGLAVTKQEAFWEACGFGNKERVRKFIAEGVDVNWVSYTHNSCAIHVASQGKKEIVQMLLDAGCNVHAVDDRGNLALHHAAMKGHADIVQMLLDAGSNVDAQNKNGWTALICAAYFCQPNVVEVLLHSHCSPLIQNKDTRSAMHEVCRSPCDDEESLSLIAKLLIAAGSDLDSKSTDVEEADFTPLMYCAYHGHPLVAQALIAAGCDINGQGTNGWTALHWAADRNHINVIRILLQANIDPLIKGKRGELAADRAQDNIVRDLLVQASELHCEQICVSTEPSTSPSLSSSASSLASSSVCDTIQPHQNYAVEDTEINDSCQQSDVTDSIKSTSDVDINVGVSNCCQHTGVVLRNQSTDDCESSHGCAQQPEQQVEVEEMKNAVEELVVADSCMSDAVDQHDSATRDIGDIYDNSLANNNYTHNLPVCR
jgi:ankyrin repeat protein